MVELRFDDPAVVLLFQPDDWDFVEVFSAAPDELVLILLEATEIIESSEKDDLPWRECCSNPPASRQYHSDLCLSIGLKNMSFRSSFSLTSSWIDPLPNIEKRARFFLFKLETIIVRRLDQVSFLIDKQARPATLKRPTRSNSRAKSPPSECVTVVIWQSLWSSLRLSNENWSCWNWNSRRTFVVEISWSFVDLRNIRNSSMIYVNRCNRRDRARRNWNLLQRNYLRRSLLRWSWLWNWHCFAPFNKARIAMCTFPFWCDIATALASVAKVAFFSWSYRHSEIMKKWWFGNNLESAEMWTLGWEWT